MHYLRDKTQNDFSYYPEKHSRFSPSLHGFTLVELLVVIAIIATLVALLIPAVNAARGSARRAQCVNHMRNLAQAMVDLDSSRGRLPGYSQPVKRDPTRYVGIKRTDRWVLT